MLSLKWLWWPNGKSCRSYLQIKGLRAASIMHNSSNSNKQLFAMWSCGIELILPEYPASPFVSHFLPTCVCLCMPEWAEFEVSLHIVSQVMERCTLRFMSCLKSSTSGFIFGFVYFLVCSSTKVFWIASVSKMLNTVLENLQFVFFSNLWKIKLHLKKKYV